VAGVTFSDSDSAPVLKFLNPDPGPTIFQIWEFDSYSDSYYNHLSNRNLPVFFRDEHGSGLKPILAGLGLDRTAICLQMGGSGLDRTKKICVAFMW